MQTVKRFGGLDILVSNAAVNPAFGDTTKVEASAWDKVCTISMCLEMRCVCVCVCVCVCMCVVAQILEVNVKATALLVKEALPYLKERRYAFDFLRDSISHVIYARLS